ARAHLSVELDDLGVRIADLRNAPARRVGEVGAALGLDPSAVVRHVGVEAEVVGQAVGGEPAGGHARHGGARAVVYEQRAARTPVAGVRVHTRGAEWIVEVPADRGRIRDAEIAGGGRDRAVALDPVVVVGAAGAAEADDRAARSRNWAGRVERRRCNTR